MKAIIPIAGLGTRLLPFSKVIPKALLPVHNKPCVQWIVEELNKAGIEEIIFIYSKGQEMVEEYFTEHTWYDDELRKRGKNQEADDLENIRQLAKFHFIRQEEQKGDGHAILQARELIQGDEACLVIFGDCLFTKNNNVEKLLDCYEKARKCIVGIQEISPEKTDQYGIVSLVEDSKNEECAAISSMIEKPSPEEAPSNLAIVGRYLLSPKIWDHLAKQSSTSGEVRLIDALQELQKEEEIFGLTLSGHWLDTGTLEGLQEAGKYLKKTE